MEERKKNGPYRSIDDFCRRADVSSLNRRTLESLVKAGAFDSLATRGALFNVVDQIIAAAQLETRMRNSGQTSMFDTLGSDAGLEMPGIDLSGPEVSPEQKSTWERELLGVPLSYNPLFELANIDPGDAMSSLDQLDEELNGQSLSLVGHVSTLTERYTREQKKFLVVSLDLLGGPVEVIVWPDVLERTETQWEVGKLVKADGKMRLRGDQFSLACENVQPIDAAKSAAPKPTPTAATPSAAPAPEPPTPMKSEPSQPAPVSQPSAPPPLAKTPTPAAKSETPQPDTAHANGNPNGSYTEPSPSNGNGAHAPATTAETPVNGNGNANEAPANPPPPTGKGNGVDTPAKVAETSSGYEDNGGISRAVLLEIRESDNPIEDAHLLREVIQVLLEYPGKDRVNLRIHTQGKRVLMECPVVSVGHCPEMQQRLETLLGADTVSLQAVMALPT